MIRWRPLILLPGLLLLPIAAEARAYPPLFNSKEFANQGIRKFPKWSDMLGRWHNAAPCEGETCTTDGWADLLEELRNADRMTRIKEVNRFFNGERYIVDMKNWGIEDYWATPYQFLKMDGDCEDYAIAKFMALKELGIPVEDMRVLALRDLNLDVGHAVLIVYDGDTPLLLDNQIKSVVPANSVKHYLPIFSLSETGWWLHRR
ncbi:transglutaminase-like cysteine peptidase [Dongia sp.]|uniref:transglutaminase-like cysteine peptidase n=1 Tax=Dongia sp. TaxID=1977262 RepID=UPI0035AEE245